MKLCTNLKRNQTICGRVIDHLVNFRTFHFPPVKIRGGMGEISESVFQAWPLTQLLIYFWWGTAARAGREELMNLKFQYGAPTRQRFSRVSGPNYTKFWKYVEPMIHHRCSSSSKMVNIPCSFSKPQRLKLSSIRPNFALFHPCKN